MNPFDFSLSNKKYIIKQSVLLYMLKLSNADIDINK